MKVYRTDKDGVTVWRLSGVMARSDALNLIRSMKGSGKRLCGCHVLDFTDVAHVEYQAFQVLENRIPAGSAIVLSGLGDYVLDIFAFSRNRSHLAVYNNWREALRHIKFDRGKMLSPTAHNYAGFK